MDCCRKDTSILDKIKHVLRKERKTGNEHFVMKKVALIGNPNVGKSVIFNSLTGAYVTVSNYPGTTVEVSRGWYTSGEYRFEIIDTPGMYSMLPITEEERVARTLLMNETPDLVIHVVDAKNIGRMIPLSLQLIEAGFPVILVLNIIDEAKALGIEFNYEELSKMLGIPVLGASALLNTGLSEVKEMIKEQINNAA